MKCCINDVNFIRLLLLSTELFKFEIAQENSIGNTAEVGAILSDCHDHKYSIILSRSRSFTYTAADLLSLQKMYGFPTIFSLWKGVGNTIFPYDFISFP